MSAEFFKVLGQIAGVAGISLGVILILFREIIRKKIFPTFTKVQAYKIIRLIIIVVFTLALFGIGAWVFIEHVKAKNTNKKTVVLRPKLVYSEKNPKVIGIYPNDLFGINQKNGLIEAIKYYSNDIDVIHLDFLSYKEMKSESFQKLTDSLKTLLEKENIIAISGPSITECTDDVLKAIKDTKSQVPIFISSAAPRDFLKWDDFRKSINLYRIATGIDDRAESLANFLKEHSHLKKTALLIETNKSTKKTYGELFFDQILKKSENFSSYQEEGKITVYYYDRSHINEYDLLFNSIKSDYKTIFLLGVGNQFKYTIDKYYRGDYPAEGLPKFGGWMYGYAMNDELAKSNTNIIDNKIFEITDLNLKRIFDIDITGSINVFRSKFGGFHPGLRDEAFSFDAGHCIVNAYKALKTNNDHNPSEYLFFNNETLFYYKKLIDNPSEPFDGISSKIIFLDGLNTSRSLSCAIYDALNNKWKHIRDIDLMEL